MGVLSLLKLHILVKKKNGAEALSDPSLTYVTWLPTNVSRVVLKVLPSWPVSVALVE